MAYTRLAVVCTCIAVVKTDYPNLYKHSYTLCGNQNGPSEPLQPSYTLCSNKYGPSYPHAASSILCDGKNGRSDILQASYTLSGG